MRDIIPVFRSVSSFPVLGVRRDASFATLRSAPVWRKVDQLHDPLSQWRAGANRRDCLKIVAVSLAGGLGAAPARAFLPLLRLLFMFGRTGALRGAGAVVARAATTRAATAVVGRGAVRSVAGAGARATASAAPTRLAASMLPARRIGTGAAGGTALSGASAGSVSAVDLGMIAYEASALMGEGVEPETVEVAEPAAVLQVEVHGQNPTAKPLNGVLSLVVADEAFIASGEGNFHRKVLGLAAPGPGATMQFAHDFELVDWPGGKLYVIPTFTTFPGDRDERIVVFDPPFQAIDVQGA
jgi:hypothetical protein